MLLYRRTIWNGKVGVYSFPLIKTRYNFIPITHQRTFPKRKWWKVSLKRKRQGYACTKYRLKKLITRGPLTYSKAIWGYFCWGHHVDYFFPNVPVRYKRVKIISSFLLTLNAIDRSLWLSRRTFASKVCCLPLISSTPDTMFPMEIKGISIHSLHLCVQYYSILVAFCEFWHNE